LFDFLSGAFSWFKNVLTQLLIASGEAETHVLPGERVDDFTLNLSEKKDVTEVFSCVLPLMFSVYRKSFS